MTEDQKTLRKCSGKSLGPCYCEQASKWRGCRQATATPPRNHTLVAHKEQSVPVSMGVYQYKSGPGPLTPTAQRIALSDGRSQLIYARQSYQKANLSKT